MCLQLILLFDSESSKKVIFSRKYYQKKVTMTTEASGQNIKVLIDSISDNIKYFDTNNSLSIVLKQLKNTVECCASAVTEVQSFVCDYDFDDENQASGYRSFIDVFDSAIEKTSNICARLIKVRGSFLFRADNYAK